jgi:hypothetical protein
MAKKTKHDNSRHKYINYLLSSLFYNKPFYIYGFSLCAFIVLFVTGCMPGEVKHKNETKSIKIEENSGDIEDSKTQFEMTEELYMGTSSMINSYNNTENCKFLKKKRIISYEMSDKEISSFGLMFNPGAVSIESIKLVGDYAYLSDVVHGNIKRICLTSGIVKASRQIDKNMEFVLKEIAYFNGLLYIISLRNKIYRITLNLDYVDSFFIPENHGGSNYLESDREMELIIFSDGPNDFIIDEKTRPKQNVIGPKTKIFQRRLHIDNQHNFSYDTLSFNNHSEYLEWFTLLRGKKTVIDGQPFYLCNNMKYEVPAEFEIGRFFGSVFGLNIDCNDKYLVFFDISLEEKKIYLHVYEY